MTQAAQVIGKAFARACRPRRRLTLSEWSDGHRMLSAKGSPEPGRWKTDRTPYLREIMDSLSVHSPAQRIVIMKSAQVGLTEVALNWIGYVVHHNPGPMLVVTPTLEVRDRWILQRLQPMLSEQPELEQLIGAKAQRRGSNARDIKDFPGGILVLSGANSPSSLRSMPIRDVVCDEVDAFPWEVGDEGDPLGLIQARTQNFNRRKILLISTPTVQGSSRIEAEYEASDQRKYHVPCPHCNEYQPLEWGNLQWDNEVKRAWYVCHECGAVIDEVHKPQMLAQGQWVAKYPERPVKGYHINGLYAPLGLGYRWIELARDWISVHKDVGQLKRFINTVLGEPWEDRGSSVKPRTLRDHAEPYRLRTVPEHGLVLTAGIDTQDDRLELQLIAWGRGLCWSVVDYWILPGNPASAETWDKLTDYLQQTFIREDGVEMRIQAAAIDTGGHHTHAVYQYVRSGAARRLMAIKGANTPGKPIISRPNAVDINQAGRTIKRGVKLWSVGTDSAKGLLFSQLIADSTREPEQRQCHFSDDLEDEYFDQLVSETYDAEKNKWIKRRSRRNEALDTWVYACAAAQHPEVRVHRKTERDWDRLEQQLKPEIPPAKGMPQKILAEPEPPKRPARRFNNHQQRGRIIR